MSTAKTTAPKKVSAAAPPAVPKKTPAPVAAKKAAETSVAPKAAAKTRAKPDAQVAQKKKAAPPSKTGQKRKYEHASNKTPIAELFIKNLGAPALKRIARRAGCVRINSRCFAVMRRMGHEYLDDFLHKVIALKSLGRRQTVTVRDVVLASQFGPTKIL
jgi:histone H3/H4